MLCLKVRVLAAARLQSSRARVFSVLERPRLLLSTPPEDDKAATPKYVEAQLAGGSLLVPRQCHS